MNHSLSITWFSGLAPAPRPGTYDYPVIFKVLGSYQLKKKTDFSARIASLSEEPHTRFNEPLSRPQIRDGLYLTRVNALHTPGYFRLDVWVDWNFQVLGEALIMSAEVQNLTDRRNIAQTAWARRLGQTRCNPQCGSFPVSGLDRRF